MNSEQVREYLRENAAYFSGYARRIAPNEFIAEEVHQNAWQRALKALKNKEVDVQYPRTWMTTIMNNELRNYIRNDKRGISGRVVPLSAEPEGRDESAPFEEEERVRAREGLDGIIARLSVEQKSVLYGLVEGLSYRALAAVFQTTEDIMRGRIHRLRKYVRRQITEANVDVRRYAS